MRQVCDPSADGFEQIIDGHAKRDTWYPNFSDFALSGSKVAFADNYQALGAYGAIDIRVADLAKAAPAIAVATAADPLYAVSFDKKYVVYTVSVGSGTGIYSISVP